MAHVGRLWQACTTEASLWPASLMKFPRFSRRHMAQKHNNALWKRCGACRADTDVPWRQCSAGEGSLKRMEPEPNLSPLDCVLPQPEAFLGFQVLGSLSKSLHAKPDRPVKMHRRKHGGKQSPHLQAHHAQLVARLGITCIDVLWEACSHDIQDLSTDQGCEAGQGLKETGQTSQPKRTCKPASPNHPNHPRK